MWKHTVTGSAVVKGSRHILQPSSKASSGAPEEEDAADTTGLSIEEEEEGKVMFAIVGMCGWVSLRIMDEKAWDFYGEEEGGVEEEKNPRRKSIRERVIVKEKNCGEKRKRQKTQGKIRFRRFGSLRESISFFFFIIF
jgi:hypothetical protein